MHWHYMVLLFFRDFPVFRKLSLQVQQAVLWEAVKETRCLVTTTEAVPDFMQEQL